MPGSGNRSAELSGVHLIFLIMGFNNDQKGILNNNGYTQSKLDENKWINGNGHSVSSNGNKTTFNTGSHTVNYGISNTLFDKKTSK